VLQALFLFFLIVEREAGSRDHSGGDENDEISFNMLINIRTEETANQWNIANEVRLIFPCYPMQSESRLELSATKPEISRQNCAI
jgi:hypothetical protein